MVSEEMRQRAAQDVLEMMCDRCDIYNTKDVVKDNHSIFKQFEMVQQDVPCRLSFSYVSRSYATTTADQVRQTLKLLLPPDVPVLPGSRIVVRRQGREYECRGSGTPAVYPTHQMIKLQRVGGWN